MILADDLGYGDLGCYGSTSNATPRLDRMAREGVRLTQFNCPAPFCAPTRASLLTGRYPHRCGLPDNPSPDGPPAADQRHLPASEITLPELLRQAGYATGMVGKWHLGHHEPWLPTQRGFDRYLGIPYSNDMRPVRLLEATREVEYPVVQATLTRRYTEWARQFIEQHRERPFLLYFAHAMPHKPLACSEEFYRPRERGLYASVLAELDASVGQVLDTLDELQLGRRTLVLFTSDNGPWYGGSTAGLRGMKGTSYEGGFRVPLIARWPDRLPADQTRPALATTPDLFATLLAAAGVASPGDRVIDGRDLLPVLRDGAASPHDYVLGQAGGQLASIRDQRWKLHVVPPATPTHARRADPNWTDPRAPDGVTIVAPFEQYKPTAFPGVMTGDAPQPRQLFDLEADPAEQHDVTDQHPDEVARLSGAFERLARELTANGETPP